MGKRKEVLETKTFQYIAIGDGKKRTFYNEDGLTEYPGNIIRNPRTMSYTNLYINGVLQPQNHYTIRHGVLHLKTIDVPPEGAPIILHFIKIFLKTKRKIRGENEHFLLTSLKKNNEKTPQTREILFAGFLRLGV